MCKYGRVDILLWVIVVVYSCDSINESNQMSDKEGFPIVEKKDTTLEAHGNQRNDSYFWMRLTDKQKNAKEPDRQTQRVLDYLETENEYRDKVMADSKEFKQKLYEEMVGRIKKKDESLPYFFNGYWYYARYAETSEYPIHCRKKENLDASEETLLDVNEMAKGHEYYSVASVVVSPNNKLIAYSIDTTGRRIYSTHFKDIESNILLEDKLTNVEPGGAWANDNETFFYILKNKVTLLGEKVFSHTLDQKQQEDKLRYHEEDESYHIHLYKSKTNEYIIIGSNATLSSDFHLLEANNPNDEFVKFTKRESDMEYYIFPMEDRFYVLTNWDAENFRLMETSKNTTARANWKEVIPHRPKVYLEDLEVFKDFLVLDEKERGLNRLRIINRKNKEEHYIKFDEEAYMLGSGVNLEFDTKLFRFSYTSLVIPNSVYEYNLETRKRKLKKQAEVVGGYDPNQYKTERIWIPVRDGEKVPVSLVYKKEFKKDELSPLLLYGYGAYGYTVEPRFWSARLSLLDRGFVFAIAHIRGGSMLGKNWYNSGKMLNKKNTFYDFIDCSKYLIKNKYTSSKHLYASGGSAGGLLMGAVVNMAPELYNGVVADVPFVDVVSTMMDETVPLTTGEFNEWGNPKIKEQYEYILSYSPYDNVEEKKYPNLLVTTGYFDSQVQYWEPAKWVAKLRNLKKDDNLLIMSTNMDAGHGGASGRFRAYEETAFEYAFLLKLEKIKK